MAASLASTPVLALDPARGLIQHKHAEWTFETGAPAPVFQIAQGKDGFLWVTAAVNLYRFDGVRFEKVPVEGEAAERHGSPLALLVADNGDVWTSFARSKRFAVYRQGALRLVPSPEPKGMVTRMVQSRDGAIWAAIGGVGGGVMRYAKGQWTLYGDEAGLPRSQLGGMVTTRDGAIWIAYQTAVVRLAPGARRFEVVPNTTDRSPKTLTLDPAGRVWLSDKDGARAITGPGGVGPARAGLAYPVDIGAAGARSIFDRDGSLWIARQSRGLQRVRAPDPRGAPSKAAAMARTETFDTSDGLSSNNTAGVFEDREGNVWVATSRGLDKFRAADIVVEPILTRPAAYGDILHAASDGAVYVAEAGTVYRVAPGGQPQAILKNMPEPEAICEAPDGTLWIAFVDRVLTWKNGVAGRRLPHPPAETGLYDCAFDRHGDPWFTAAGSGLYRYRAGRWETMYGEEARTGLHPQAMSRDGQGRMVIQWSEDAVAWLDPPRLERTKIDYGGARPETRTLDAGGPRTLAAGTFGLARIAPGSFEALSDKRFPAIRGVNGIVQTPSGDIWTAAQTGITRFSARDLDRAFADKTFTPPTLRLDFADGLPDRVANQGWKTIVRGGDGRLWVSTDAGTVWLDPARIRRNTLVPPVAIGAVSADGVLHRDPRQLTLPARTASIQIDYAALSLAVPERVRFRYRLEGFDKAWVEAGDRRQAFYTNLPPGRYRFQVTAANDDGVWNNAGASVAFEIPPAFTQSAWFLALCAASGAAVLWLVYRLRMARVAQNIRRLLEERLGERERIARELHDTLLQSVQGLILRFQSAAERLPEQDPTRQQLEATLKRADDVMVEGRDRVRDLRLSEDASDLRGLIETLVEGTGFDPPIPVRIVVEGRPRPVDTLVGAEVGRIVGEALSNIIRHARASAVEIEICFAPEELRLLVQDDGVGLDETVLRDGEKKGHFGLVGMRERATRIGGTLIIESRVGKGTAISLTTPARLAYQPQARRGWRRFWPWRPTPSEAVA